MKVSNRKFTWIIIANLISLGYLWPISASASEFSCPQSILVEQKLLNPPALWDVMYEKNTMGIASVSFYDGLPADAAALVNNDQQESKTEWTAIWHFPPNSNRGYSIACGYEHTNAILSKRLPKTISECRVSYEKSILIPSGGRVVKRIDCK